VDLSTFASGPTLQAHHLQGPRRRVRLPVLLFLATCLSTFWVGATDWEPMLVGIMVDFRQLILRNWEQGLVYMGCVLAILMTHELGHFFTTLWYRVPASLPFFIPLPITPIGTMGAVIAMEGRLANRKEIFDIGLAGPLAGLVAAIPILCIGIARLDMSAQYGSEIYDCPLLIEWLARWLRPDIGPLHQVRSGQLNAHFMAGWVGLLITGLNMWPVSQLDGGHVVYALFGRRAHWIARGFVFAAILFVVLGDAMLWAPMLILVILMGTDHPRTANDNVPLSTGRRILGGISLLIPLLCFPPYGIQPLTY
jgi:membrane-associated protease RseP (regulator of RpoE activity)